MAKTKTPIGEDVEHALASAGYRRVPLHQRSGDPRRCWLKPGRELHDREERVPLGKRKVPRDHATRDCGVDGAAIALGSRNYTEIAVERVLVHPRQARLLTTTEAWAELQAKEKR